MSKKTYLIFVTLICLGGSIGALARNLNEPQIELGTYVFVSFSMNDESLRSYFREATHYNAKLVMRGLVGGSSERNRFALTKEKMEKARINVDINPVLFEQLNVSHVPAIVTVSKEGKIKKVSGHISLEKALEIMDEHREVK